MLFNLHIYIVFKLQHVMKNIGL